MTYNSKADAKADPKAHPELTGLFDEMMALMAVMPGAGFNSNQRLSTEEELEEMLDNMPV